MPDRYIPSVASAAERGLVAPALPGVLGLVYRSDLGALDLIGPDGVVIQGGLDRFVEVTLTNAQILALRATPITLVAAPGAGKRLQLMSSSLNVNATAGVYSETADNLAVRHVDGSGVIVSQAIETTGFVDQAGKMHTNIEPKIDGIGTEAQLVNTALVLHNTGDGELGGGNAANSMKASIRYRVVAAL